jgi:hypothetical protein
VLGCNAVVLHVVNAEDLATPLPLGGVTPAISGGAGERRRPRLVLVVLGRFCERSAEQRSRPGYAFPLLEQRC